MDSRVYTTWKISQEIALTQNVALVEKKINKQTKKHIVRGIIHLAC